MTPGASTVESRRSWMRVVAVIVGAVVLVPLNSTMVAVALPSLMTTFARSVGGVAWIVTAYLVAMASLHPVGGRLGDLHGHRRVFLAGSAGFGVASVACALAPSFPLLVLFRAVQGACGAVMAPNGAAILQHAVGAEQRGRAFGWLGAGMAAGAAVGPALGGLLVHYLGWSAIFWVNLPVLAVAVPLAVRFLPVTRPGPARRFDIAGALLLTVTLAVVAVALARSTAAPGSALSAALAAMVLGGALVVWERRPDEPIVDFALFRHPAFVGAAAAVFLTNLVMYTTLLLLPLFLAALQARTPVETGGVLFAYAAAMSALSPVGGHWSDRSGRALPVVAGAVLALVASLLLLGADRDTPVTVVVALLIVSGAATGLQMGAEQSAALESAPASRSGMAGGIWATARYLGSMTAAALLGVLIDDTFDLAGFRRALGVAVIAGALLAPLGALLRLSGRPLGLLAVEGPTSRQRAGIETGASTSGHRPWSGS